MRAPTPETFEEFINIATSRNVPISGSLGRAVLTGKAYIDPVRPNGSIRDIDIVNVGQHTAAAELLPEDLEFDRIWLSRFIDEDHLTYPGKSPDSSKQPVIAIPVPHLQEILEPASGIHSLNNQPCIVLKPEAQLAIDSMFSGNSLSKRLSSIQQLSEVVNQLDKSQRLHPELLEPFASFSQEVAGLWRRKLYVGARAVHHALVPNVAKTALRPCIKKLARGRLV